MNATRLTAYRCPLHAVVLPRTTEEVAAAMRICHNLRVPVIPRGAETSLAGGALPTADSVVRDVREIDTANRFIRVQTGVTNLSVSAELEVEGFFYAPNPRNDTRLWGRHNGALDMANRIEVGGLQVDRGLYDFVNKRAMPGTGIKLAEFWAGFAKIVRDLAPKNRALLEKRDEIQEKIDAWHRENGAPSDMAAYKAFLKEIGYLLDEGPDFRSPPKTSIRRSPPSPVRNSSCR